ncbi:hypothetical protein AVEN_204352-1 [Araneus ventricosus]|uniref:Uncharacterized protein n=1 Tax=Araneus ventricosus TaxID=182803 RepID=A0A4Y2QF20_ARAVE|nr:hypothetical protein AVEN_204352-1 [Araneus ventricosus]
MPHCVFRFFCPTADESLRDVITPRSSSSEIFFISVPPQGQGQLEGTTGAFKNVVLVLRMSPGEIIVFFMWKFPMNCDSYQVTSGIRDLFNFFSLFLQLTLTLQGWIPQIA